MHGGRSIRRKWGLGLVILLLTLGFLMPAPMPAMAASGDTISWPSAWVFLPAAWRPRHRLWHLGKIPRPDDSPACSTVNFMREASWGRHSLPARISAIPMALSSIMA